MTETTFSPFDAADYLETEADVAAYLDAVADENPGDAAAITRALGVAARARNMSRLSREIGISREGLYKAFSGEGNPSFANVVKMAAALGLDIRFTPKVAG